MTAYRSTDEAAALASVLEAWKNAKNQVFIRAYSKGDRGMGIEVEVVGSEKVSALHNALDRLTEVVV